MKTFTWNLVLAILWPLLTGRFSGASLAFGFLLGYVVLSVAPGEGRPRYFEKVPGALRFAAFFLWDAFLSALRVAFDVVTPHHHMRPGTLAIPLEVRTDAEITLLATLITLTPGTLALDVSPDRRTLFVHAMYLDSPPVVRRRIKEGYERRVLELLR